MAKIKGTRQRRGKTNIEKVIQFAGKHFPSFLISIFAIGLISVTCLVCYFQTINKTHFSDRFIEILVGSTIFLVVRACLIMIKSHYNKNMLQK